MKQARKENFNRKGSEGQEQKKSEGQENFNQPQGSQNQQGEDQGNVRSINRSGKQEKGDWKGQGQGQDSTLSSGGQAGEEDEEASRIDTTAEGEEDYESREGQRSNTE